MKNKILCLMMVFIASFCMSVPAFAATESTEGEEPETEVTEPATNFALDGATVNISDESIQAIADAVATASNYTYQNDYQYWITLDDGTKCLIDTDIPCLLDDYGVFIYLTPWGYYCIHVYELDSFWFELRSAGQFVFGFNSVRDGSSFQGHFYGNTLVYSPIFIEEGAITEADSSIVGTFLYSNHDWVDANTGVVWYETPYTVSYLISFNSGFNDLTIPDQISTDLVLPLPQKDGYIFLGWYLDPDYMTVYTADYRFTANTTLFAKWTEEPPMAFFSETLFNSFTVLLESPPIFYLVSLMGLVLVIGVIKVFVSARL